MTPRRTEPKGKPFMRVPVNAPKKREPENRPNTSLQRGAIDRANREQAREAEELRTTNMKKKPMKKYAKGGSVGKADGIAKKGKTHTKMVKMACGGKTKKG